MIQFRPIPTGIAVVDANLAALAASLASVQAEGEIGIA